MSPKRIIAVASDGLVPMKKSIFIISMLALLIVACSESFVEETIDPPTPDNPFDEIDYGDIDPPDIPVDSNTFIGLHTYIFSTRCNQPACHDGTFEPDFRTVQSAYNSLVQHPVLKNYDPNLDGKDPLPYRVAPGSLDNSMMWQRLTNHEPPNFERMPSSGNPLPNDLLNLIESWIEDGAKDPYGNAPMRMTEQPNCFGLLAYVPTPGFPQIPYRVDTLRDGNNPFNTFITLAGVDTEMWLGFMDYVDEDNFNYGENLTVNKIQLSTNPFNFNDAIEIDLEVVSNPRYSDQMFSQHSTDIPQSLQNIYAPLIGENLPYYHKVVFNPVELGFSAGSFVFMRILVQDEDHDVTQIPEASSVLPMATYYSFFVFQP